MLSITTGGWSRKAGCVSKLKSVQVENWRTPPNLRLILWAETHPLSGYIFGHIHTQNKQVLFSVSISFILMCLVLLFVQGSVCAAMAKRVQWGTWLRLSIFHQQINLSLKVFRDWMEKCLFLIFPLTLNFVASPSIDAIHSSSSPSPSNYLIPLLLYKKQPQFVLLHWPNINNLSLLNKPTILLSFLVTSCWLLS